MANQPAAKFKIGLISAIVWANEANGRTHHNVVLSRSYKDGNDWKETDQLGHGDIMNAVRVLQRAEQFISDQQ